MAAAGLELKSRGGNDLVSWLPGSVHGGSSPTWLLSTTGQIFSSLHLGPVFCFPLNCHWLKLLFRIHSSKKRKKFHSSNLMAASVSVSSNSMVLNLGCVLEMPEEFLKYDAGAKPQAS